MVTQGKSRFLCSDFYAGMLNVCSLYLYFLKKQIQIITSGHMIRDSCCSKHNENEQKVLVGFNH